MNKKTALIVLVLVGSVAGAVFGFLIAKKNYSSTVEYKQKEEAPVKPTPEIETPERIEIPDLNISAEIEPVGLDMKGNMDVPKKIDEVAWYKLGAIPGQTGNAVIAGHLDWYTGPAVFYRLNELAEGSNIIIYTTNRKKYRFKVIGKDVYPHDQFPIAKVFGSNQKQMLNLITCGGKFNKQTKNYSQRIVVYSELTK